ncbi:MAG: TQO small subunit DoxA domain-containing protein [Cyclobacteriaceae bacterium]
MKNTFRWLGLIALPLRLIIGGILIVAFILPLVNSWAEINIFEKIIIMFLGLLSFFLVIGFITRLTASFILVLSILSIFTPAVFQFQEVFLSILIMASTFVIFITGGGAFSLDHLWARNNQTYHKNWFRQIAGGDIPLPPRQLKILTLTTSILFVGLLVYLTIHGMNPIQKRQPLAILIADSVKINENALSFNLQYGDRFAAEDTIHLVYIKLFAENDDMVAMWNNLNFNVMTKEQIINNKNGRVKTGEHSLMIAPGAKSTLLFYSPYIPYYGAGPYWLHLEDISGKKWTFEFEHYPYQ